MKPTYKAERDIVDLASSIPDAKVCFYPGESVRAHRFLASIREEGLVQRERPDFEDLSASLLLEAMVVDDHPRPGKKDKTRARGSAVVREVEQIELVVHPHATVFAAVSSGLPTDQDHNYRVYVSQFTRTVSDHARKVERYRSERPGFDLGFLVFDESTAYFETAGAFQQAGQGHPHAWFADASFVEVMKRAGADCFLWLTPFKHIATRSGGAVPLPEMTIIDIKLLEGTVPRFYNAQHMVSAED